MPQSFTHRLSKHKLSFCRARLEHPALNRARCYRRDELVVHLIDSGSALIIGTNCERYAESSADYPLSIIFTVKLNPSFGHYLCARAYEKLKEYKGDKIAPIPKRNIKKRCLNVQNSVRQKAHHSPQRQCPCQPFLPLGPAKSSCGWENSATCSPTSHLRNRPMLEGRFRHRQECYPDRFPNDLADAANPLFPPNGRPSLERYCLTQGFLSRDLNHDPPLLH